MNLQRTSTTAFGLISWLEQTQIHLPLKAIKCRFEVSGAAADVQIDQIFHQSAGRPPDVTYSFPLPSKAAAYRCEMIVNGRTIRAKVMEQEAAREIAKQKKAEGRRTTLVEMERGNLFTLSLGRMCNPVTSSSSASPMLRNSTHGRTNLRCRFHSIPVCATSPASPFYE